ncbi:MAG TPA: hypothetical protein VEK57_17915 [Thermoanaerobaculia bacterium]|nr:hypothetical protein [Thermoanaerobaculia bacterium]
MAALEEARGEEVARGGAGDALVETGVRGDLVGSSPRDAFVKMVAALHPSRVFPEVVRNGAGT